MEPIDTATLIWQGDALGHLSLIDQTRLPVELVRIECHDVDSVDTAIRGLHVRGAPAIGIAAAYGVCLGIQSAQGIGPLFSQLEATLAQLSQSRPTAVNLFWALDRMRDAAERLKNTAASERELREALLAEAKTIHEEDRQMCHAIGRHGESLLADGSGVLTHCNAGGLATSEYGTALAVLFSAQEAGKQLHVYVDETRPLLQGARLTAWELRERGIATTLICDSMAAHVMQTGRVQAVITGADRITANGDVANKIGTYGLAIAASAHNIPFYVAAPRSTFDLSLKTGEKIPIEERSAEEITHGFGRQTAPDGISVYNPAFDVTPAELITAIVCDAGIIRPVNAQVIRDMLTS